MAKVLLWVGTFPATVLVERVLSGASWQVSLDKAWATTMVVGVGFLFVMARNGLRDMRSGGQGSRPSDSE